MHRSYREMNMDPRTAFTLHAATKCERWHSVSNPRAILEDCPKVKLVILTQKRLQDSRIPPQITATTTEHCLLLQM